VIPAADQQKTDLPSRPSTLDHWRRLFRLARKELREILRDRRTIITLILMPVLVYPLLSIAFQQFFLAKVAETLPPEYVIGFRNEKESNLFVQFIDRYTNSGKPQHAEDAPLNDTVKKPVVKYDTDPDLKAAVRDGKIDLGIEFEIPPDQASLDFDQNLTAHCRLIYDPASSSGQDAYAHITSMLDKANVGFLSERLQQLNVTQRAVPVDVEAVVIRSEKVDQVVSLTSAIPLILILMTITGAVYPAIDLTAGERERGTLEILIAAPIPRIGLLIAKYIAVITVAMLTASVNLFMMTVTLTVSGLGAFFFGPAGLSFQTIVQVFCLLMLFAMFFSAVLLTLTSFAAVSKKRRPT